MSKASLQITERLWEEGKTVSEWAKERGFPVRAVRAVIYGHNQGNWGQAHRIAVALGLKGSAS
jgi:gp16 family phage-associated protein